MSSESFDKIFKNKLSEIEPQYTPSVWNRISGKLPVSPFLQTLKKVGPWVYGAATTTILIWLAFQMQDLKRETHSLRESLVHAEKEMKISKMAFEGIQNRLGDTVYLVKSEDVSIYKAETLGSYSFLKGTEPAGFQAGKFPNQVTYSFSKRQNNSGNVVASNPVSNKSEIQFLKKDSESHTPQIAFSSNVSKTPKSENSEILPENLGGDSTSAHSKSENIASNNQPEIKIHKTDSTKSQKENIEKTKVKSSFRFADLSPKIGVGFVAGLPNSLGLGPDFEFNLGENLGLSIGLLAFKGIEREFISAANFNESTGYVFQTVFKENIPKEYGPVHEIKVLTSVIELPLRLKYYAPVSEKLSLIFSGGTHFNISTSDKIRYEVIQNNEEVYNTFSVNSQKNIFHNFTLGLGIQRKGQNVVWQFSPFYTYNFRQPGLFEQKSLFGLALSCWFPLVKQ